VLAHLDGIAPGERIEIAVRVSANSHTPVITIRHQAWGNGIGWFTQASVKVPTASLAELKRALCLVPGVVQRRVFYQADHSESEETLPVIPFPGLRDRNEHNSTAEDCL
jgi:hypothetical protein